MITERDFRLLYDCYHHSSLSVAQIRQRHFPSLSKSAAHNRLSALREMGLLRPFQVGTVLYHGKPKKIGVVYRVSKKAIERLREKYALERFRDEPIRLSTTTLSHDLLLTEVIAALKQKFPQKRIITGAAHGAIEGVKRLPDALILNDLGRPEVAIELELTTKTKKRYRDIVFEYKLTPQFSKVLYVVGSKNVHEKVRFAVTDRKDHPLLPPQTTGKFYFGFVTKLLENPRASPITNGATELQL